MSLLVKKHHPQCSTVRIKLFLLAPITTFFLLTCTKWVQAVTKKLEKEELNVTSILAFNPAALCQVLLGSSGLLSSNASESQAALSALETAMRLFPKQFFPQFLLELDTLGDRTLHDALSQKDIKVKSVFLLTFFRVET
jgi:hypothetical protein